MLRGLGLLLGGLLDNPHASLVDLHDLLLLTDTVEDDEDGDDVPWDSDDVDCSDDDDLNDL